MPVCPMEGAIENREVAIEEEAFMEGAIEKYAIKEGAIKEGAVKEGAIHEGSKSGRCIGTHVWKAGAI